MNNKPVAWMCQDNVTDEWEFSSMKHCHKCEPLYTHPANLTDEEWKLLEKVINDCAETIEYRIDVERLAFKGYEHCSELESLYEEQKDASKARAILRKVREHG